MPSPLGALLRSLVIASAQPQKLTGSRWQRPTDRRAMVISVRRKRSTRAGDFAEAKDRAPAVWVKFSALPEADQTAPFFASLHTLLAWCHGNVKSMSSLSEDQALEGHSGCVWSLAWSPSGAQKVL